MGHKLVKVHTLRFDDLTHLYSVISYRSHIRGMFEGLGERSETVYRGHTDTSSYMLSTIHKQVMTATIAMAQIDPRVINTYFDEYDI